MNRINNLNPDIERTKNAVVEATTVEEFVTATNASLKLRETFLNKLINSSAETEVELTKQSKSRSEPTSRTST